MKKIRSLTLFLLICLSIPTLSMAETVNIPDPKLRAAVQKALGKNSAKITAAKMAKLKRLEASRSKISDLTGLEYAENLKVLKLSRNRITDLSPLTGLTNLKELGLMKNRITDVSPLVDNTGLGDGDVVNLLRNPLDTDAIDTHIPALEQRGVTVKMDTPEQSGDNPPEPSSNAVNIPDSNLRAALELALDKATGATITETDMETLTRLTISRFSGSISDLTGLEYATNLTHLSLRMVGITDISPIADLTNLTSLSLPTNGISDISSIKNLTNLTSLSLPVNHISDISPIENLTNLTSLDLSQNHISNISPLAGLTKLTSLFLSNNSHLSSIKPVKDLTNLTDLRLGQNNISHISWLSRLTNLTSLSLSGNRISDISSIKNLTNLQRLHLSTNGIRDIASLSSLTNLTYLSLSDNYISDISSVAGLTNLQTLTLSHNGITNISSVAGLTNLQTLTLGRNSTTKIKPRTKLDEPFERLTDISAITNLTKLSRLHLGENSISDISPVAGLTNLTDMTLHNNNITDISSLAQLTNLNDLWLAENSITDISSLVANTGLGDGDRLLLSGNPLSAESINTHIPALKNRGVNVSFSVAGAPKKALTGIPSVLGLSGEITDQTARQNRFRVTVKNLSNAKAALTVDTNGMDYQLEVEAGQAGDILEISAQSADRSIAVQPLRYTLTKEDVLRGRIQLPALVAYEIPTETELLANYPNPFNPETWIPYRLAADAFVTLTIYDQSGQVVRTIDVGHQIAAVYESRSKAIHWDGRNASGEPVSSGVYFYHLSAGDYAATRRMLILK